MKLEPSDIRQLILTIEYLRFACEHAEGKDPIEAASLLRATCVGIRVAAWYHEAVPDYQQPSYWRDVFGLPRTLGLASATLPACAPDGE